MGFSTFQTRYFRGGISGAAKGQARAGKDPHGLFQSIVNTLTNAQIDDDLYDQLEEQLILADVGPACAVRLVDELHDEVEEKHLKTGQEALDALRGIICQELTPATRWIWTASPPSFWSSASTASARPRRLPSWPACTKAGPPRHAGSGRYLPRRRQ